MHLSLDYAVGDWCRHIRQASPCRVIDRQDVWGEVAYRVWLPAKDAVVRARGVDLAALESVRPSVEQILHTTAAAKLLDALEDNLLPAPIQSSVVPLPHQLYALNRAVSRDRERFEDLISVAWDLVIIDEAHRMGGSTSQVARYKLGAALAEASPYLLLLSATPHQGKTDQFMRLMQLLDRDAFPDESSVSRDRVRPFVIRTEKRASINAEGQPLFKPRVTRLQAVAWQARHGSQQRLYEAVTDYVRHGYNQAMAAKQRHIGFLMILMQRLVTSSTAAIRTRWKSVRPCWRHHSRRPTCSRTPARMSGPISTANRKPNRPARRARAPAQATATGTRCAHGRPGRHGGRRAGFECRDDGARRR
ncbi:SNF2-related protein [Allochromatium tepidum]|nr:SNF2-related protein [Allochromatium tepidum]